MSRHLLEPLPPVVSAQESSEREGESGAWPGFFPQKKGGLGPSVFSRAVSLGEARGRENQIQNNHTI